MEKENKNYRLIESFIKKHKKYPGLESILDDIIDDVYSHSEVILNTVTNESVINAYLEKVVSTSIITVPKRLGIRNSIPSRVIEIKPKQEIPKVDKALVDRMINNAEPVDAGSKIPTMTAEEEFALDNKTLDNIENITIEEPMLTETNEQLIVHEEEPVLLEETEAESVELQNDLSFSNIETEEKELSSEVIEQKLEDNSEENIIDNNVYTEPELSVSDTELVDNTNNEEVIDKVNTDVQEPVDIPESSVSDDLQTDITSEPEQTETIEAISLDPNIHEYEITQTIQEEIPSEDFKSSIEDIDLQSNEEDFSDEAEDLEIEEVNNTGETELTEENPILNEKTEVKEEPSVNVDVVNLDSYVIEEDEDEKEIGDLILEDIEHPQNDNDENAPDKTQEEIEVREEEVIDNNVNVEPEEEDNDDGSSQDTEQEEDNLIDLGAFIEENQEEVNEQSIPDTEDLLGSVELEVEPEEASHIEQEPEETSVQETISETEEPYSIEDIEETDVTEHIEENEIEEQESVLQENINTVEELQDEADVTLPEAEDITTASNEEELENSDSLIFDEPETLEDLSADISDNDFSIDIEDDTLIQESDVTDFLQEENSSFNLEEEPLVEDILEESDDNSENVSELKAEGYTTINYSQFNFEPDLNGLEESIDKELITKDLEELSNKNPDLNILKIYNLKYKENQTIPKIASDLQISEEQVIEALNEIIAVI